MVYSCGSHWSNEDPYCVLENLEAIIGAVVPVSVVLILIGLVLVVFCVIYYKKKRLRGSGTADISKKR